MMGSGSDKRSHDRAIRAAKLRNMYNHTYRDIAKALGVSDKQVKKLVLLGERLENVK